MSHFVLAITGPAGAGKSTVGEKIAKSFRRCVNIDADHIKHMIVSGFHAAGNPGEGILMSGVW
jgi:adenylate kinase family enzyme